MLWIRDFVTSAAQLILARAEAFRRCDFGFIFDSYHPDSNFRRQFADREEYIRYGWANLGKEFRVLDCTIVREEAGEEGARVIFVMEFEFHGERQRYAELAWLDAAGDRWFYHCGQKLTADELPVPVGDLEFRHFEEVSDKVIY